MIRAAILSLAFLMAGVGSVSASECGKLCTEEWWEGDPTQEEVAAEIATVDVNARAEGGSTPLHWAVRIGTPTNIKVLLKAGANVNAQDESGSTPLHYTVLFDKSANVLALLDAGADGRAKD